MQRDSGPPLANQGTPGVGVGGVAASSTGSSTGGGQYKTPRIQHPYVPWPYAPPAPPPMLPCTDPLPWESSKMLAEAGFHLAHYHRWETEKKARRDVSQGGLSGLASKTGVEGFLKSVAANIEAGVDASVTGLSSNLQISRAREEQRKSAHRFEKYFPLIKHEHFWQSYDCRMVNGKVGELGEVYITDNSLAFSTEHCNKSRIVKFAVPLRNIVTIRRASVRFGSKHKEEAPILYFIPDHDMTTKVDGYQVYTSDNRVHVFYHFVGPLHEHFFNVLDHAWRTVAVPYVPMPPMEYKVVIPQYLPPQQQQYFQKEPPPAPLQQAALPMMPYSHREQVFLGTDAMHEQPVSLKGAPPVQQQLQQPQQPQQLPQPHITSTHQLRVPAYAAPLPPTGGRWSYHPGPSQSHVEASPLENDNNVTTTYIGASTSAESDFIIPPPDYRSNSGPPPPVPSRASKPPNYVPTGGANGL